MDIVPAIEETNATDFKKSLDLVKDFASRIHVDFNDGMFQGFQTAKPEEIGILPENINFEAHLMVAKPFDFVPKLKEVGFRKFVVQWETDENIRDVIEELLNSDVLVGVAIGPETPVSDLEPVLELLDSVTIMTVIPGKQGQKFLVENLKKVQELHEGNYFGEIQVDGGINDEDIKSIISFRPETLIVGSYILKSSDPVGAYNQLADMAN